MTKVCYQALPMSAFTTLQKRVFPLYFRIQSGLVLLTAVTFPPYGPASLVFSAGDAVTIGFTGAMALLNLTIYGPRTQQAMIERTHQQTREGRSHDAPGEPSEEMIEKRKIFSHNHAMSIHLNLLAMGATVWYGLRLASRLQPALS
ncbi:hypothetical protein MMC27_002675 [Xylographa pallens]|nr:hypothetical protein [Xylographa pallens]